jgi:hypothetical protein
MAPLILAESAPHPQILRLRRPVFLPISNLKFQIPSMADRVLTPVFPVIFPTPPQTIPKIEYPPSFIGTPLVYPRRTLGLFAEQVRMEIPKDLGQRINEAARLAVALHLQHSSDSQFVRVGFIPGGTVSSFGGAIFPIGGADHYGGAATDGLATAADREAA